MYIYNVWTDDVDVDYWTYDPRQAMVVRDKEQDLRGEAVNVTRYIEDEDGVVNIHDTVHREVGGYVRMTDEMLREDMQGWESDGEHPDDDCLVEVY